MTGRAQDIGRRGRPRDERLRGQGLKERSQGWTPSMTPEAEKDELEIGTDREQWAETLTGHEGPVLSLAVLRDGCRALSGSADCTICLWDLKTGRELRQWYGHRGGVTSVVVLPDEGRILSGSYDGTMRLWELETGAELRRFDVGAGI